MPFPLWYEHVAQGEEIFVASIMFWVCHLTPSVAARAVKPPLGSRSNIPIGVNIRVKSGIVRSCKPTLRSIVWLKPFVIDEKKFINSDWRKESWLWSTEGFLTRVFIQKFDWGTTKVQLNYNGLSRAMHRLSTLQTSSRRLNMTISCSSSWHIQWPPNAIDGVHDLLNIVLLKIAHPQFLQNSIENICFTPKVSWSLRLAFLHIFGDPLLLLQVISIGDSLHVGSGKGEDS